MLRIRKMKIKGMEIGVSNFGKQNTPKRIELIGNISLILAGVAAVPLALSTAGVAVPAILVTIGGYATAGGVILKKITKLFGESDTQIPQ